MRLPKINIRLKWENVLLSNFTICLIIKYGRTIQNKYINKDMFNASKKYINIFRKAIDSIFLKLYNWIVTKQICQQEINSFNQL
jgi:hypothetical protein